MGWRSDFCGVDGDIISLTSLHFPFPFTSLGVKGDRSDTTLDGSI